jgi:tetratricopeptide (TPR) repeat protein
VRRRGDAEAALERWSAAQGSYNEALTLVHRLGDTDGEIRLTLHLAATEQALARPHVARPLLDQALRLSTAAGTPMQARVWLAVADFEASLDRDGPALRAYERAVTLAGATQNAALEARGLRRRGDYERRRGKLAAARGTYEVAIRLAHSREAWGAEALSRVRAAELAVQIRDLDTAREQYASAAALYEQHPQAAGAARVALGVGDIELSLGELEDAQSRFAQALALATQSDHVALQIAALDRLTKLLTAKEPQIAEEYLQRAAALRAEAFGPSSAQAEA